MLLGSEPLASVPLAAFATLGSAPSQPTFVRFGTLPVDANLTTPGFIDFDPAPFQLGIMSPHDQDGAWLIDCTAWATARGSVTLVSIGTPLVQRRDTVAIDVEDVTISGVGVLTVAATLNGVTVQPGFGFFFDATTNGNATTYYLGFPLTDSAGNVVTRWGELPVIPLPG